MRIDGISNGGNPVITADLQQTVGKVGAVVQPNDDKLTQPDRDRVELSHQAKKAELDKAIDKISKTAEIFNRHLQFEVHDKTKEIMVKIIDNDTGEVIDEIPPKKLLDIMASLQELVGKTVDKKG